jgi:hypothetical protein
LLGKYIGLVRPALGIWSTNDRYLGRRTRRRSDLHPHADSGRSDNYPVVSVNRVFVQLQPQIAEGNGLSVVADVVEND